MEFSEKVIVLQTGKFKENDIWVRLLSPTRGIFSAFAFGGSKSRQRFVGCLDIFNQVLFRVKGTHNTEYLALQEGVLIKGVSTLRKDWKRLGIANNCVKFLQTFGIGIEGASHAHALFLAVLEYLDTAETINPLLPLFFRLRLVAEQGYALNVTACDLCGTSITVSGGFLIVRDGQILCASCCRHTTGGMVFLSSEAINALWYVIHADPYLWGYIENQAEKKEISTTARRECGRAIDEFIQYHVGLHWENSYFRKV